MTCDFITVLRSRGPRLAKRISLDAQIECYDHARLFDVATVPVAGLDHLALHLGHLAARPRVCIVRGRLIDGDVARRVRRLVHTDPKTGAAATLTDAPHQWIALDFDSGTGLNIKKAA